MQIWASSNLAGSSWISFIITVGESTWCCSDHKNALENALGVDPSWRGAACPCSHSLSSMVPGDICCVMAALLWAALVGTPVLSCMVSACHGLSFWLTVVVLCWTGCEKSHQYGCTSHQCYGMWELGINLSLSHFPPSPLQVLMETFGVLLETGVEKGKAIFLLVLKLGQESLTSKKKASLCAEHPLREICKRQI